MSGDRPCHGLNSDTGIYVQERLCQNCDRWAKSPDAKHQCPHFHKVMIDAPDTPWLYTDKVGSGTVRITGHIRITCVKWVDREEAKVRRRLRRAERAREEHLPLFDGVIE